MGKETPQNEAPRDVKEDLKKTVENIKNVLEDEKVDSNEAVTLKNATDFLEANKNNTEIGDKVVKISEKYKADISSAIINQLEGKINLPSKPGEIVSTNKWVDITSLVSKQAAQAYINIINRTNKNPLVQTNKTPDQIRKDQEQKTILNGIKTKLEAHNEKIDVIDGEKYLFDLLSSTPSLDNAKNLFWDNGKWVGDKREKTWEALKKNTNNNKFEINKESKIDNAKNLNKEQLQKNFEKKTSRDTDRHQHNEKLK